jgi:hypothetical protein
MHVTTWDPEGLMVLAHGLGVGRFQELVDLAVRIVKELDLTHAELVGFLVPGVLCDLLNRLIGKLQVVVIIHELRHGYPLLLMDVRNVRTGSARLSYGSASQRARPAGTDEIDLVYSPMTPVAAGDHYCSRAHEDAQ